MSLIRLPHPARWKEDDTVRQVFLAAEAHDRSIGLRRLLVTLDAALGAILVLLQLAGAVERGTLRTLLALFGTLIFATLAGAAVEVHRYLAYRRAILRLAAKSE